MPHSIRTLTVSEAAAHREGLIDLLFDSVANGAGVSFIQPMTRAKAEIWWDGALASHARGERAILAAEADGLIVGSVQLIPAAQENQPYRADIAKLLVHSQARRQGIGEAMMRAVEAEARRLGRTLLTLDTEKDSVAERLYARLGWTAFGEVLWLLRADGVTRQTATFFRKEI